MRVIQFRFRANSDPDQFLSSCLSIPDTLKKRNKQIDTKIPTAGRYGLNIFNPHSRNPESHDSKIATYRIFRP
jgi:hypothetical protein